jgi:hypothetical protein
MKTDVETGSDISWRNIDVRFYNSAGDYALPYCHIEPNLDKWADINIDLLSFNPDVYKNVVKFSMSLERIWEPGPGKGLTLDDTFSIKDIYFCDRNDDYFGEPDEMDPLAELFVGRACIGTINEAKNFVDKTLNYINSNEEDPHLKKILFLGEIITHEEFGKDRLEELRDMKNSCEYTTYGFPTDQYNIDTIYDKDYDNVTMIPDFINGGAIVIGGWPKLRVTNTINQNVHIINHIGHGLPDKNMRFNIIDLYLPLLKFKNTKPFFVYSTACFSGAFDNLGIDQDCIAEHLTVKTENGAFAGIWNSREGWWGFPLGIGEKGPTDGPSQRYLREFWDAVFNPNENKIQIGKANQYSKEDNLYLVDQYPMRWIYYELNLLGDPSVSFKISNTENHPPSKPKIEKITIDGKEGYKATATDPDNDQIFYIFDWGEGTLSEWQGPYDSSKPCEIEHPYVNKVKVKAKDEHGLESEWSEPSKSYSRFRLVKSLDALQKIQSVYLKFYSLLKKFYPEQIQQFL